MDRNIVKVNLFVHSAGMAEAVIYSIGHNRNQFMINLYGIYVR